MAPSEFTDQLEKILQQNELKESFVRSGEYGLASKAQLLEFDRQASEGFYQLINLYASANASQREAIRKQWNFDRHWVYPNQDTLACTVPSGRSSAERIGASLIRLSILADRQDYRDTLVALCQIYHSARLAGLEADQLVNQVASLSSEQTARLFKEFINRDEYMKSFKVFYFKEVPSANGIRIERDYAQLDEGWPSVSEERQGGASSPEVSAKASVPFDLERYLEKGQQSNPPSKPWWRFW